MLPDDLLAGLSEAELRQLAAMGIIELPGQTVQREVAAKRREDKERAEAVTPDPPPATDDELWEWIKEHTGFEIPRVSVCEGHCSPFEFLSDLYFGRTLSALAMANRGGSKTFLIALLHYVNGLTKPGIEGLTFGATEAQAQRCYEHLKKMVGPTPNEHAVSCQVRKTVFRSGASAETVPGSEKAVNGPHPNIAHADEVELMDPVVWSESRGMAITGGRAGRRYPGQDVITSTRKRAAGKMQELIDEVENAKANGYAPPYDLYTWCVFDVAENVPNCMHACPDLPPEEQCGCDRVVKGTWHEQDGTPIRTLADVCQGRLAKSHGFFAFGDVRKKFVDNSRAVWEAQFTCEKPSTEGMVWPMFTEERHVLTEFDFDPHNGPIYQGIDFGGENPHACVWIQQLKYEVRAKRSDGQAVRLSEGTRVCFAEVYKAGVGNQAFIELVKDRDARFDRRPGYRIASRFADPQGKSQRFDFHAAGLPCSWWGASRDVKEQVKTVGELLDDDRLFIVGSTCPNLFSEMVAYHYPMKKPGMVDDPDLPVDDFNHAVSGMRYCIANLVRRERRLSSGVAAGGERRYTINDGSPVRALSIPMAGPRTALPGAGSRHPVESWRPKVMPVERDGVPWLK